MARKEEKYINNEGLKQTLKAALVWAPKEAVYTNLRLKWLKENIDRLMGLEEENKTLKAQIEKLEGEYLSEQTTRQANELRKLMGYSIAQWGIFWNEHFNGLKGHELVDALIAKRIEFENSKTQDQKTFEKASQLIKDAGKMIPPIARGFVANPLDRVDDLETRLSKLEADHNGGND